MTKPTKWVCAQRRLRSAWTSAQSDQSLRCPHEESLAHYLPTERTAKSLIRLGGCPGWSESSLVHTHFIGFVMSWLKCLNPIVPKDEKLQSTLTVHRPGWYNHTPLPLVSWLLLPPRVISSSVAETVVSDRWWDMDGYLEYYQRAAVIWYLPYQCNIDCTESFHLLGQINLDKSLCLIDVCFYQFFTG